MKHLVVHQVTRQGQKYLAEAGVRTLAVPHNWETAFHSGVKLDLDKKNWRIQHYLTQSSMGARTFNLGDSVFLYSLTPVQRHITGVLENTRVFFSTPVLWCHITGVLTNTRVFSIIYPGQLMTAETACGLFRRISGVLSFTDFSLSSSLMLDACNLYTALLELKKLRVLREWLLLKGGKPGGGEGLTMDYTIVHGQTVSKYRWETICLKDFEVVTSWRGDVVRV